MQIMQQPIIQICQDASYQDRTWARALCSACSRGNIEKIYEILREHTNLINHAQVRIGIPPLCIAVQRKYLMSCRFR
ncbi:MAG: hypothetical protein H0T62_14335 [Parachlamydiaceae bacterium]|nr:hypothetical protein [Parachlamydiaceae bacterium]